MLEKLNAIAYDATNRAVIKRFSTALAAASERSALCALQRIAPDLREKFLVPSVGAAVPDGLDTVMECINGIRVYDFVAILNKLMNTAQRDVIRSRACRVKEKLIARTLDALAVFQSESVQAELRNGLSPILSAYDFNGKLIEALTYASNCLKISINEDIANETRLVCNILSHQSAVIFRDASLKNMILVFQDQNLRQPEYSESIDDFHRYSDRQHVDSAPVLDFLDKFDDANDLPALVYQIDFESCHGITVAQDDWFHILMSEVVDYNFDQSQNCIGAIVQVEPEVSNLILLLRGFREWARRLFYFVDRPYTYTTRYAHETLSHNFYIAYDALIRLQVDYNRTWSNLHAWRRFMNDSEKVMRSQYASAGRWRL